RYGLTVHANELNPVASVILKATLDYPARFGTSLVEDIRKYGRIWCERLRERLEPYFPLATPDENIFTYLWARTVACPETGKPVPLSPNWWLRKGSDPIAVRVVADPAEERCRFEIVHGGMSCKKADPDRGTVKRGTGLSPWTGDTIDGDYIKGEAQAGRMGQQLYAVGFKKTGEVSFRAPTEADEEAVERAEREVAEWWATWQAKGLIPEEPRKEGRADWACEIYGATRWCDTYNPRQLLSIIESIRALDSLELEPQTAGLVRCYLSTAISKVANYNCRQSRWHAGRDVLTPAFQRHDLSLRWSYGEFDSARNVFMWAVDQTVDSLNGITSMMARRGEFFGKTRSGSGQHVV